jgi:hydroxymethylbilane synthase
VSTVSERSLPPLRLATRGSRQALGQSGAVAAAITAATGRAVDLVTIETTGDVRVDVPLHEIGGQGVFVKEVQRAVLDGRADLAVHSAKDLQSA